MSMHVRVALAALAAVAAFVFAAGTASANRLTILNSSRGFRIVWTEDGGSETDGVSISCEVTMEGTFAVSSLVKTSGTTIGRVTRARTAIPCRRGGMIALAETLPWPVLYRGFTGTLPVITGIRVDITEESWRLEDGLGNACLYRSEANHPERYILNLSEAGAGLRRVDTWRIDETASIPLTGLCTGISVAFSGTATATVQGETAKTVVALI